ncbi:MAG: Crp/Fnr family transcriptional regulator, partial [Steroidobacteraceae bacterium]
ANRRYGPDAVTAMSLELSTTRLAMKLSGFVDLSADEHQALQAAAGAVRLYRPHETLTRERDANTHVNLLLTGFACRCKVLPDGRRQIIGYLIPGDLCDARQLILRTGTHAVSTLTAVKTVVFSREALQSLVHRWPRIAQALCCLTLVEEMIEREWLVNVGQRTALERLAHLFCEIFVRMRAAGLADSDRCELPLTQMELADTLALSTVHINRTLQELRRQGFVSVSGGMLEIHDFAALQSLAMFNPDYLHVGADFLDWGDRRLTGPF